MGTGIPTVPDACPGGSGGSRDLGREEHEWKVWSCLWEVRPWRQQGEEGVCTTEAGFVRVRDRNTGDILLLSSR